MFVRLVFVVLVSSIPGCISLSAAFSSSSHGFNKGFSLAVSLSKDILSQDESQTDVGHESIDRGNSARRLHPDPSAFGSAHLQGPSAATMSAISVLRANSRLHFWERLRSHAEGRGGIVIDKASYSGHEAKLSTQAFNLCVGVVVGMLIIGFLFSCGIFVQ
mmetsp:Transcript_61207/g.162692  ORF Transcript_61207/g.162692 Transcript_61207/m.162692 type:complete len:161 (-) Transcript_61207:71-553(-)|eukprot:CAMPEP_0194483894 /NCGR_PEP_ID=MMETSP0253-20130528/5390_1 /TAXON_ID=2966 /ORGANISM="Noctiluca scintillans" /LENGTH=160 /DNA_ID=CAMNT_0039323617 /DNA_START=121 /DNA_END=603 /DNA_ORIENTATION=-